MFAQMGRALMRPSLGGFEQARANANLGRALIAALVIGALTGFIGGLINMLAVGDSIVQTVTLTIITPLRFIFALIIVQAILFSMMRALGGCGNFETQTYLSALVFIPINALARLLESIPTIGAWLAIVTMVYGAAANVPALRAAHGWRGSNGVLFILSLIGGMVGLIAMSSIAP